MSLVVILKLLLVLSIVLLVFALALRAKVADALYLVTEWRLGVRALVAMYVVVPAVAMGMAGLFALNPAVKVAMVALALSPLPPILPGKQMKSGGRACYVTGLLVASTVLSIVVTPLGLAIASTIFHVEAQIAPAKVATTVAITILIPLLAGFAGGAVLGPAIPAVSRISSRIGSAMLVIVSLVLLVKLAPAMWEVLGEGTLVALAAMSVAGLAAGYFLAGGTAGDRMALSLASATRHPGVALAIAMQNFPDTSLAPAAIVLGLLLSLVIAIPFVRLMGRQDPANAS